MRKERIPIPKPRSLFLLVRCQKCENEQIVYSMTNSNVNCKICDSVVAERTGGKANVYGLVIRRLD